MEQRLVVVIGQQKIALALVAGRLGFAAGHIGATEPHDVEQVKAGRQFEVIGELGHGGGRTAMQMKVSRVVTVAGIGKVRGLAVGRGDGDGAGYVGGFVHDGHATGVDGHDGQIDGRLRRRKRRIGDGNR